MVLCALLFRSVALPHALPLLQPCSLHSTNRADRMCKQQRIFGKIPFPDSITFGNRAQGFTPTCGVTVISRLPFVALP